MKNMPKTQKEKAEKLPRKLTKQPTKKDQKLIWAGGAKLLEKSENKEVQKQKNMILVASSMLNVSPFGVNVLGGTVYLNKVGRKQKLKQYGQGKWHVEYQWIQRALDDSSKAICEARVVNEKGVALSAWVTGEASPSSMKMGTLSGYQNHMAETRAHNRAIEEFIGTAIHEEMLENISKMQISKGEDLPLIGVGVSPEEMNTNDVPKTPAPTAPKPATEEIFCYQCAEPMTAQEGSYSSKVFGKPLCRNCQKLVK